MASAVDICNLALGHLGDEATVSSISPPEGSAQAEHCARFYPVARDVALVAHAWNFATRRIALAAVTNTVDSWAFAYAVPTGYLAILSVLKPESTDDTDIQDFVIESTGAGDEILYTNVDLAVARYIVRVVDTAKFSPLFVSATSWLLASYLAGPIMKGKTGLAAKRSCLDAYAAELGKAAMLNANSGKTSVYPNHVPQAISVRQ